MEKENVVPVSEAQVRFDQTYISTNEIASTVGVTRATVLNARKEGRLPGSICLVDFNLYLWEREQIKEPLKAWIDSVKARRNFESVTAPK